VKKLGSALLCSYASLAHATPGQVEIWVRAFIPNPLNAGLASQYIRSINGDSGSVVTLLPIKTPNICFSTDNRGFSFSAVSTARLETRFTVLPVGTEAAEVLPSTGRSTAAVTHQVDCQIGEAVRQAPGRIDRDHMGQPAVADGVIQVVGQAQATNVIPLMGHGPSIDYSWDVKWRPFQGRLSVRATYGNFPAFEVYARTEGGDWIPVYKREPSGSPWDLAKDSLGIGVQSDTQEIQLYPLDGVWHTDDDGHRFTLKFNKEVVTWSETSSAGAVLRRAVTPRFNANGSVSLERPNDNEVLSFLGYQPTLQREIQARAPRSSFLTLKLDGKRLIAEWNGLLVTKDAQAHLKELIQPGERAPKVFGLKKVN